MTDWKAIQSEYEQGASLRSLAAKHGVSKTYIIEKRNKEQWNRPDRPTTTDRPSIHTSKKDDERQAIQAIFLATFERSANITESCRTAGIDRSTFYDWLEKYETFSLLYNQAKEIANDTIRAEIFRRGHDGYDEQVLVGGRLHTVHKYSNTLLIFLAKARMPEFREKQPDININNNLHSREIYKYRIPDNGRD